MTHEHQLAEARYLLVKRGLYYRPNNCGYTGLKREAGRYFASEGHEGLVVIHEDHAPEYSQACYPENIIADKDRQIAELTAALASYDSNALDPATVEWCAKIADAHIPDRNGSISDVSARATARAIAAAIRAGAEQ